MAPFDAIVVGGGVLGASILHHLSRNPGYRCLLLESETVGGGTTSKSAAMIRTFHSSPELTAMAAEGLRYYRQFAKKTFSEGGFVETGMLYFDGMENLAQTYKRVRELRSRGINVMILERREGEKRFSAIQWPKQSFAVFEPEAGYANPSLILKGWIQDALRKGAEVREGIQVLSLINEGSQILGVNTPEGEIWGKTIILSAGAQVQSLAMSQGVSLPVHMGDIQFNRSSAPKAFGGGPMAFDIRNRSFFRPDGKGKLLFGIGLNQFSPVDTQEEITQANIQANQEAAFQVVSQTLRGLSLGEPSSPIHGRDLYTQGRVGLLGKVSGKQGLFVAAGFGGTGFKVAPFVGRRMTDLISSEERQS